MLHKLGPYRIERLLGRGGMGAVYAGVHEVTGERAAIKSLSLSLADDKNFRARFLVEIETLKQLRHPNIVQMIGDGEQDGNLFFVMELVEGQSLQEALQSGHVFGWREVLRIAIDVCGALKQAHDRGIIHRDLKPANLLLTKDGRIKLTDFGIAKLFGATHRTADGSVVGTADYMAPEQADGRTVTNRTDLYSLGAVMFTLLARRTPFSGGNLPQVIHRLKFEDAPSVRRFAPDAPDELDRIITELLRKEPQQRVATALVLANRLRAMEHALPTATADSIPLDQASTRVADPGSPPGGSVEDTTAPPSPPKTKLTSTRADQPPASDPPGYSWNNATVLTSGSKPADGTEPPPVSPTSIEPPERRNRFTTLVEHQQRHSDTAGTDPEGNQPSHLGTVAMVALAGLLVGLCVWGLSPPSADTIYGRIQQTVRASSPADAIKEIELFTQQFPGDPRFAEVESLRMDVECGWLAKQLGLQARKSDAPELEPYQRRWLEAYRDRETEPARARAEFESLLAEYSVQEQTDSLTRVLAAARHLLERVGVTSPAPTPP